MLKKAKRQYNTVCHPWQHPAKIQMQWMWTKQNAERAHVINCGKEGHFAKECPEPRKPRPGYKGKQRAREVKIEELTEEQWKEYGKEKGFGDDQ